MNCTNCQDQGWVCENHPHQPWNDGIGHTVHTVHTLSGSYECGGAGMMCPECHPLRKEDHACSTGDCPHATQAECDETLKKEYPT